MARPDYVGEALLFAWLSWSIFRWVVRTAAEIRDPPEPMTELEARILADASRRNSLAASAHTAVEREGNAGSA